MGKSAKIHKRSKKKTSNADTGTSTTLTTTPIPTPKPAAAAAAITSAKKAKLNSSRSRNIRKRAKLGSSSSTGGRHVLGGADYVDLMMGSRRRAREEALKLPRDGDTDSDVTPVGSESLSTSTRT